MGFRYAIIGSGRQGTAAAYDLAMLGDADYLLMADMSLAQAERAAFLVYAALGAASALAYRKLSPSLEPPPSVRTAPLEKSRGVVLQLADVLQRARGEVIDHYDPLSISEQPFDQMGPDEASTTGDQDMGIGIRHQGYRDSPRATASATGRP